MTKQTINIVQTAIIIACCIASQVLISIFLNSLSMWIWITALIVLGIIEIGVCFLWSEKLQIIKKMALFVAIFALLAVIGYIILDATGFLAIFDSLESIKVFIEETKGWGVLVYFIITIAQVVILPLPSTLLTFAAANLYGSMIAFVVTTVGTILGSIICFALGRIFGKKLVTWMIGKEKLDKYADIITNKGKLPIIVMFLLPFFPDDILCLVAGVTNMTFVYFLLLVVLTRPFMIAIVSFFGTGEIIPFSGWGIPVWIAIFATIILLICLVYFIKKKREKQQSNDKIEK